MRRSMQGANAQQIRRLEEAVEKLEARNRELLEAYQVRVCGLGGGGARQPVGHVSIGGCFVYLCCTHIYSNTSK